MKKFCQGLFLFAAVFFASINGVEVEKFEFQAEVSRMMDIIINSLYQKKEVFLREVISNSADALDKLRFLSLQDPAELGTGDEANLEIKIKFDEEEKTLTIKDTGIGMTKEDLVQNLGTVAKSGTSNFMEQLASEGGDLSLIGQFGVGFYSVYLVADKVQVTSKNNHDKQYIWESTADNTFTIKEDAGESIGRGTEIKLFLKEDALEYMNPGRLEELVKRYSEFVGFPIYLYKSSTEMVEDADDDDYDYDDEEDDDEDDLEADDGEDDEDELEETVTWEWVRLNDRPAIWTRSPSDITDEEYSDFYQGLSGDTKDPFTWTHFKAEGEVEFRAIMFIPPLPAYNLYENYHDTKADLKLYVRKVLIKDDFDDLLPQYLNFIKGVVDSDDLPLSVSRETIQQAKAVSVISKKLTKKALDMLIKLSKDEKADPEDDLEEEEDADVDDKANKMNYTMFYKKYGRSMKLGVLEDSTNKNKLAKLLRFKTTYGDELTSLPDYVARMKEWQSDIYFLTGENVEVMRKTPFLKRALKKGAEVLLLDEPIDEYIVQTLTDFEGNGLQSLSKEGLKFGDDEEEIKKLESAYKKEYKPLTKWLKNDVFNAPETGGTYGAIDKILITITRLDDSVPGLIVSSSYGHGANMEKIMKSQTLGNKEQSGYMTAKKIMELNPRHPIVDKLNTLVEEEEFEEAKNLAWLLYDSCLMSSGFELQDTSAFTERFYKLIQKGMNIESLEPLPMMDLPEEEEDEELLTGDDEEKQEL